MTREQMRREAKKVMEEKLKVCGNCGSKDRVEIHHIVPISKGGTNNEGNLVYLCNKCHHLAHSEYEENSVNLPKRIYLKAKEEIKDISREEMEEVLIGSIGRGTIKIVDSRLVTPYMEKWLEIIAKELRIRKPWEFDKLTEYIGKLENGELLSNEEENASVVYRLAHEKEMKPQEVMDKIVEMIEGDELDIEET